MVDFGSEQGLSDFEAAGIARYFEDFKRAKTQLWTKRCHFWMDKKGEYREHTSRLGKTRKKIRTSNAAQNLSCCI